MSEDTVPMKLPIRLGDKIWLEEDLDVQVANPQGIWTNWRENEKTHLAFEEVLPLTQLGWLVVKGIDKTTNEVLVEFKAEEKGSIPNGLLFFLTEEKFDLLWQQEQRRQRVRDFFATNLVGRYVQSGTKYDGPILCGIVLIQSEKTWLILDEVRNVPHLVTTFPVVVPDQDIPISTAQWMYDVRKTLGLEPRLNILPPEPAS